MEEKIKVKEKFNIPVTILLFLGLITIAFPLYMTIVIAFKQPSEMTNSISGILSLPKRLCCPVNCCGRGCRPAMYAK